ncbi:MAG: hypothetical protein IJY66_07655 [Clostridia bacterium]|nr:hypothetical protein [Clostridia bacterium]
MIIFRRIVIILVLTAFCISSFFSCARSSQEDIEALLAPIFSEEIAAVANEVHQRDVPDSRPLHTSVMELEDISLDDAFGVYEINLFDCAFDLDEDVPFDEWFGDDDYRIAIPTATGSADPAIALYQYDEENGKDDIPWCYAGSQHYGWGSSIYYQDALDALMSRNFGVVDDVKVLVNIGTNSGSGFCIYVKCSKGEYVIPIGIHEVYNMKDGKAYTVEKFKKLCYERVSSHAGGTDENGVHVDG